MDNKKVFHESGEKMHKKLKMTLQRAKNLVQVKQPYGVSFYEKDIFLTLIYIADMAIQMSNIDNVDIGQMFSKFAQR